jgi:hypothetical protein
MGTLSKRLHSKSSGRIALESRSRHLLVRFFTLRIFSFSHDLFLRGTLLLRVSFHNIKTHSTYVVSRVAMLAALFFEANVPDHHPFTVLQPVAILFAREFLCVGSGFWMFVARRWHPPFSSVAWSALVITGLTSTKL